jgi:hypothetical protein
MERSPSQAHVVIPSPVENAPASPLPREVRRIFKPREYHHWESPFLMGLFLFLGLGISMAHCGFYARLEGTIVGSPAEQENNLRQVTTQY